jgi:glucose-1-phosphate thymidylyltransferase
VFVGPNTSIGDNTKLSQCTIRNSIIMNDCEIYCNVTIKNSIVSSNSKILKMEPSSIEKVFLLGEGTQIKL